MKLGQRSTKYAPCACGGSEQRPRTIVIHSTEGATAEGAAAYLKNRTDGSAHVVVDNNDTFVLQSARKTTCGVGCFNAAVYHIEQAGFAAWSHARWLRNAPTIRRAAYEAARQCVRFNIDPVWLSAQDLRNGKREGITSHAVAVQSGITCSTHTDPGKHYPRRTFMTLVKLYIKRIKK